MKVWCDDTMRSTCHTGQRWLLPVSLSVALLDVAHALSQMSDEDITMTHVDVSSDG